jgi:hypothetical protein
MDAARTYVENVRDRFAFECEALEDAASDLARESERARAGVPRQRMPRAPDACPPAPDAGRSFAERVADRVVDHVARRFGGKPN